MAENIKVTLILDDTQYTGKLATAGANAEAFGKKVAKASDDGVNGFDKLTSHAETLASKMEALTTIILGVGFLEAGRQALALSDEIADLSKGTDVSIARILQLRAAFEANGGSAEGLAKVLSRLSNYIQDARDGSASAQESLLALGLTFKDMANLNTDQAIQRIIEKLAQMEDPIARNALAFRILGKEAKNIDWAGVLSGSTSVSAEFQRYEEAIKKAAEAHDKLNEASAKLLIAFTGLLESTGVLDFLNNMDTSMSTLEKKVILVGAALGLYFGAKGVILMVEFATAIRKVAVELEGLAIAMGLLEKGTAFGRILSVITILGVAAATYFGIDKLMEAADERAKKRTEEATEEAKKLAEAKEKAAQAGGGKKEDKPVTPAWEKELVAIRQISDYYEKQLGDVRARVDLETKNLGLTEDQIKYNNQISDLEKTREKQLDDINKQLLVAQALADNPGTRQQGVDKINALNAEKKEIEEVYKAEKKKIEQSLSGNAEANAMLREAKTLYQSEVAAQERLLNLTDEYNKMGLTETEKKIYDIGIAARKRAQDQINEEEKLLGYQRNTVTGEYEKIRLSEQRRLQIVQDRMAEAQAEGAFVDAAERNARRFENGWTNAWKTYADEATNASKIASNLFNKTMSGMEDLIVKFVKTGKFEWKSFVSSMLEELLRSNIKQVLASIFDPMKSTGGGLSGLLGSLGNLLGGGGGSSQGKNATNPLFVYDISGGGNQGGGFMGPPAPGGGGIFDSIKNVFGGISDTVGSIFSDIGGAVSNVFGGITDAIGGLFGGGSPAKSSGGGGGGGFFDNLLGGISDFFGGFFAGGGTIPGGKFGLVGENGPELVTGPAQVTPNVGSTNVTYNINAVDAQSFKAMIASDPSFLYAVTQQGARGVPSRR